MPTGLIDLRNETVQRYHDISGSIPEGYFTRFEADQTHSGLGLVFDMERVGAEFGSLQELYGPEGYNSPEAYQQVLIAGTSFALLHAIPQMDVKVGRSGMMVTSAGGVSPASAVRVSTLKESLLNRAYQALCAVYTHAWFDHGSPRPRENTRLLRELPWTQWLIRYPDMFRSRAAGDDSIELNFFRLGPRAHSEEFRRVVPLVGTRLLNHLSELPYALTGGGTAQKLVRSLVDISIYGAMKFYMGFPGRQERVPFYDELQMGAFTEAEALLARFAEEFPEWRDDLAHIIPRGDRNLTLSNGCALP